MEVVALAGLLGLGYAVTKLATPSGPSGVDDTPISYKKGNASLREAFESEDCRAQIPAAVLRERLTRVTEPARGKMAGHDVAAAVFELFKSEGMAAIGAGIKSALTEPQTVEEAIYERCKNLYPDGGEEYAVQVVKSFRSFVALAERKERETGQPCTVYASY